jgi:hypothetical protein
MSASVRAVAAAADCVRALWHMHVAAAGPQPYFASLAHRAPCTLSVQLQITFGGRSWYVCQVTGRASEHIGGVCKECSGSVLPQQ